MAVPVKPLALLRGGRPLKLCRPGISAMQTIGVTLASCSATIYASNVGTMPRPRAFQIADQGKILSIIRVIGV